MSIGAPAYVLICTVATNPCPSVSQSLVTAYLIDPLYQSQTELLLAQSGINWDDVYYSFGLSLVMFAVGAGVGVLINLMRKVR